MTPTRPPIFTTFITYSVIATLLQIFFAGMGLLSLWMATNPLAHVAGGDLSSVAIFCRWAGWLLLSISIPRAFAHGLGPVLPRRPWAWRFNITMIGIGCVGPLFFLAIGISREWGTSSVMTWYGLPPPTTPPPPATPAAPPAPPAR